MSSWFSKLLGRAPRTLRSQGERVANASSGPQPADAAALIEQGNVLLNRGQTEQAAQRYRLARAADPSSVAAAVNLGFALAELTRPQEAAECLRAALTLDPVNVDALFMLGRLSLEQGDAKQASEYLRLTVQSKADFGPAYPALCRAHIGLGDTDAAMAAVQAGLKVDPESAELRHYEGNLNLLQGHLQAAVDCYRAVLAREPRNADSRASLGHALLRLGEEAAARRELQQALTDQPASAEGCQALGNALQALGSTDLAMTAYHLALQRNPKLAAAHQDLGILQQALGQTQAALASLARASELQPDSATAWCNLGTAYHDMRQYERAERCYRRATEIDPAHAAAHAHLAVLCMDRGDVLAAQAEFDLALARNPGDLRTRSNQLWALCHQDDPQRYVAAAKAYGRSLEGNCRPFTDWHLAGGSHPLRVGLVSGDLRAHPVGYFIESVLGALSSRGIELHAFPTSSHEDATTKRLRMLCAGWTPLVGMSDQVAAGRIRDERIHVLVDLAGHTAHNRLPVFAWRPAPVQVSWLGYFASTGVPGMDYVLADPLCAPADFDEQFTETVWRLPSTRLCFTPPAAADEYPVTAPPSARNGFVTLGCYQNAAKVNGAVLRAWAAILQRLPRARLRLQSKQTTEQGHAAVLARLEAGGLDARRVVLVPPAPRAGYLQSYAEVDLLLDTFPFPGGTTTCEALWMGVPTVSLEGHSMMGNQGKALLTYAGLADWVARSEAEYVDLAVARAEDPGALARLRSGLRDQVLASPLFDGDRLAADLAQALSAMYVDRQRAATPSRIGESVIHTR